MLEFDLDPQDVFDQFFVIGLMSIVDHTTRRHSQFLWRNDGHVSIDVGTDLELAQVAEIVRDHAKQHSTGAWLTTAEELSVGTRAPLSPRIGNLSHEGFEELEVHRERLIDTIASDDELTRRLVGALGQPSYWAFNRSGKPLPDAGASAWEMKTRNRGEEFLQNRLSLLAGAVSQRSLDQVESGLEGALRLDEVGKNSLASRTPTGLRTPGLVDNARAWCALWGVSAFPVLPVVGGGGKSTSVTVGALRAPGRVWFYLPVLDTSATLAAFKSVARSRYLAVQAAQALGIGSESMTRKGSRWLEQHGCRYFFTFFRHRTDNANAPELWAEPGIPHDIAQESPTRRRCTDRRHEERQYVF